MKPAAYYNEFDPYAAQWLRNLIAGGHIAPGEVDERSIEDVAPDDLRGFTQCHFFAGIGGWSHALRVAGWPDDKPVWTGSCPCQPFSSAGKGDGFDDERHLWPDFAWLIGEQKPVAVFGEQVAAGNANVWFDLVQSDLEGMGYAFGLVPFTSAGIGAPHIRERAYWVADAHLQCESSAGNTPGVTEYRGRSEVGGLDNSNHPRLEGHGGHDCAAGREGQAGSVTEAGFHDRVANPNGQQQRSLTLSGAGNVNVPTGWLQSPTANSGFCGNMRPLEVNGFWRDADWLFCRDGKWRPVEPGTFPLVDGFPKGMGHGKSSPRALAGRNRVGRLRGYGNAINVYAAAAFIRAYMEVI
ncbi:DNA cytosine methyltransferase [Pseudescherichia sp.]|uniref:DNA cytosine methyltransferase n=1 Tax=Pseudescherichia sp. TaxID=2055881 RepID=UPI0028A8D7B7|nr:DNA cytosine methyltransferase [Pseudescherichia sp.]